MITDEQFSDLVEDVKDIASTVKHMDERMDLMASKSELYDVRVLAQKIGFKNHQIHWVVCAILSVVTFLLGRFFPW